MEIRIIPPPEQRSDLQLTLNPVDQDMLYDFVSSYMSVTPRIAARETAASRLMSVLNTTFSGQRCYLPENAFKE
jgi:hypothetical protein